MRPSETTKPATASGEPALDVEQLGGPLDTQLTPSVVNAQLVGTGAVLGKIKAANALDLCRALVSAGFDPNAALVCHRGNKVALRIRTIGEGAKLTIREDGLRVVPWKAFSHRDVAAPMRQIEKAV
jgi:hypothetical protein